MVHTESNIVYQNNESPYYLLQLFTIILSKVRLDVLNLSRPQLRFGDQMWLNEWEDVTWPSDLTNEKMLNWSRDHVFPAVGIQRFMARPEIGATRIL